MKGGYRKGSGRKKGSKASHTLEAQEAKKIFVAKVSQNLTPMVDALITQAKNGDTRAFSVLMDRAFGKTSENVQLNVHPSREEIERDRVTLLNVIQTLRAAN